MNRRKAATVRRVVQNKRSSEESNDGLTIVEQDVTAGEAKNEQEGSIRKEQKEANDGNEVIVSVDIQKVPTGGKDDNQNYISSQNGGENRVVEIKNKAAVEKKNLNKVSLNAVLARLSPLKKQMKAALALKSTSPTNLLQAQTNSSIISAEESGTINGASASSDNMEENEVQEDDVDGVAPIVIAPTDDGKKKKRRPSVKATLAKKAETMKPATKMALKAKIKQKGTPKSKFLNSVPQTQSPVALPPAPEGFMQSSPLINHSGVLGTCFLLPVKQEPVDNNDDLNAARAMLKEKHKGPHEDISPLDLSISRRDDLPNSYCEELDSEDKEKGSNTTTGKKTSPGHAKKRKLPATPVDNKKQKKEQGSSGLNKVQNTPRTNGKKIDTTEKRSSSRTPKRDVKSLPVVLFSAKKTARKSIRDPSTPSPLKSNEKPEENAGDTSQSTEVQKGDGVILNKMKLEGSNQQIVVKQENNEIVISIESNKSNQGNHSDDSLNQSILDLTMSPECSMNIASVVDRAIRAAASNARMGVNAALNLSEEETDENARANSNVCQSHENSPMNAKSGKVEKPKECPICGKVFNRGGNLVGHMRKHTGERPYVCDICQKGFTFLTNLRAHMNVHTGERPYKCKECDKAYTQLCGLQRHMASHSDAKPFVCETCKKAFKHLHVLRRHELVHGEYRPYQCLTCGKGFLHAWHLEKHVRVHTGERPFKCDQCQACFTQKTGLQGHVNRVHLNLLEDSMGLSEDEVNQSALAPSEGNDQSQDDSTENINNDLNKSMTTNDENGNKIIEGKKKIMEGVDKENDQSSNTTDSTSAETINKAVREVVIGLKDLVSYKENDQSPNQTESTSAETINKAVREMAIGLKDLVSDKENDQSPNQTESTSADTMNKSITEVVTGLSDKENDQSPNQTESTSAETMNKSITEVVTGLSDKENDQSPNQTESTSAETMNKSVTEVVTGLSDKENDQSPNQTESTSAETMNKSVTEVVTGLSDKENDQSPNQTDSTSAETMNKAVREVVTGLSDKENDQSPNKTDSTSAETMNKSVTEVVTGLSDKENDQSPNKTDSTSAETLNKSVTEVAIGLKDLINEPKVITEMIIKIEPEDN